MNHRFSQWPPRTRSRLGKPGSITSVALKRVPGAARENGFSSVRVANAFLIAPGSSPGSRIVEQSSVKRRRTSAVGNFIYPLRASSCRGASLCSSCVLGRLCTSYRRCIYLVVITDATTIRQIEPVARMTRVHLIRVCLPCGETTIWGSFRAYCGLPGAVCRQPGSYFIVNPAMTTERGQLRGNPGSLPKSARPHRTGVHPVFLSPAEIPLIVAAIARLTSGVSSPARLRRSMST